MDRAANRPLRLGFVSADFAGHPTGCLVSPAFEHLDRAAISMVCYSDRVLEDEYTARFRAVSDQWRVTYGLADEELAAQIRQDEIDILFDLMGHTGRRLMMFARKPAPLQVSWLGYVGTTGWPRWIVCSPIGFMSATARSRGIASGLCACRPAMFVMGRRRYSPEFWLARAGDRPRDFWLL